MNLEGIKKVHFIGIGGIGISALARFLLAKRKMITGSDRESSKITDELALLGAKIFIPQKKENIPADCDLVIYNNAIPADNPELMEARKNGLTLLSYPQALGEITRDTFTVAVSGTHGKTTTTAMIAKVLIAGGLEPSVIVGSFVRDPKTGAETNFISGTGNYFVVEADEYKRAFLNLRPKILVVNNLDLDHLDYYKDLADIQKAFSELAAKVPEDGWLVCDSTQPNIAPILRAAKCRIVDYGKMDISDWKMKMPGGHNRSNAEAAATVAQILGVASDITRSTLENFEGVWRRFEYKGMTKGGTLVYDDYAHNPEKVKAVLAGAREMFPRKKIIAVFQPHLFSRTKMLFSEFAGSFTDADEIIIAPIYAAREKFDPSISSEMLAVAIRDRGGKAQALGGLDEIISFLQKAEYSDSVLLLIGAGDVNKISSKIL